MSKLISSLKGIAVAGAVAVSGVTGAIAQTAPTYSFNLGITSDYIFRGISQTDRSFTGQGGLDVTYGKFYAGLWASGLDFGQDAVFFKKHARAEVDLYAGFKPVVGPVTFDLGVIYYAYPGAYDDGRLGSAFAGELNYVELKAGASFSPWKNGTLAGTAFFSPDYTNSSGKVWTLEASFSQELPKIGTVTPTFSALLGYQIGNNSANYLFNTYGNKEYLYWNAGVTFGWEKFALDLRYWDTDIKDTLCPGPTFQCDGRFMGTLKFTY